MSHAVGSVGPWAAGEVTGDCATNQPATTKAVRATTVTMVNEFCRTRLGCTPRDCTSARTTIVTIATMARVETVTERGPNRQAARAVGSPAPGTNLSR